MALIANERLGDGPAAPDIAPELDTASVGAGIDINGVAPEYNKYNNGAPSLTFNDILNRFETSSRLSVEGNEFVKRLTEELQDEVRNKLKIQVKVLPQPNSTLAISCNGKAIILLFAEAVSVMPNMATVSLEDTASRCLNEVLPGVGLLSVITVAPQDYKKVDVWVKDIRNTFIGATTSAADDLVNGLLRNTMFTFSDDKVEYENAVRGLDPHEVPCRHDFCLTIYVSDRKQQQQNTEQAPYFQSLQTDRVLFGTVSGYTEFVRDEQTNLYKFYPIVHISDIQCIIKSARVLPIFLVAAAKKFMMQNAWYNQYANVYMGGSAVPQTTLGCLIPDSNDPTGRFVIDTPDKWNQFCANALYPAQLVLDVNEGRSKIPGIEMFSDMTKHSAVIEDINQFLGAAVFNTSAIPCMKMESVYRGVFNWNNMMYDTQFIDFINEYSRRPTESAKLEKLNYKRADPTQKAADFKEIEPESQFYYRTDYVILPGDFMIALCNQLASLNVGTFGVNGIFNISGYAANANAWNTAQKNMMYGPTPVGGFNPINWVYR